jgi:hypothetical protein
MESFETVFENEFISISLCTDTEEVHVFYTPERGVSVDVPGYVQGLIEEHVPIDLQPMVIVDHGFDSNATGEFMILRKDEEDD